MPIDPKIKEQILRDFERGYGASELAKKYKTPLRTIQRWIANYRRANGEIEEPEKIIELSKYAKILEASAMKTSAAHEFLERFEDFSSRAGAMHSHAAQLFYELLVSELGKPDFSSKIVGNLSLCMARHLSEEQKIHLNGKARVMDAHQAMSLMITHGYMIFDGSKLREIIDDVNKQAENAVTQTSPD